jgi:hypothetical protein
MVQDAKVAHDWRHNMIITHGNGIIKTIVVTKKLGTNLKRPKDLLCFDN